MKALPSKLLHHRNPSQRIHIAHHLLPFFYFRCRCKTKNNTINVHKNFLPSSEIFYEINVCFTHLNPFTTKSPKKYFVYNNFDHFHGTNCTLGTYDDHTVQWLWIEHPFLIKFNNNLLFKRHNQILSVFFSLLALFLVVVFTPINLSLINRACLLFCRLFMKSRYKLMTAKT